MAEALTIGCAAVLLVLAVREGWRQWRHSRAGSPAPRVLLALLPLAAGMMLMMCWLRIGRSPYEVWNGARTAPAVAWVRGMPLYYAKGLGPAPDFIQGPIAALVRAPAAAAKTPTSAILIADLTNAAIFYLPVLALLLALRGPRLERGIALLVFLGFSLTLPSLVYSAFKVHADAPAVGLAILGCACMVRAGVPRRRTAMLILAGLCAVLSVFSKQNLLLILLALPLYAQLRFGWRAMAMVIGSQAAFFALLAGVSIAVFGYEPLVYSTITIPSRHPWWLGSHGRLTSLLFATGFLIVDAAAPATAMGVALLLDSGRTRASAPRARRRLIHKPWFLPLMVALIMIPSCLVGRVKQGGVENALTPTTCFLVAALAAWIARPARGVGRTGLPLKRIRLGASALLAIVLAVMAANPWHESFEYWREVLNIRRNPQQMAYTFALDHPNQAFFPWHPLATLMADGRQNLFEYGVVDLYLAGEFMNDQRIRANVPRDMKYLVYPPEPQANDLRRLLPEYSQREMLTDMSDWQGYIKPAAGGDASP